MLRTECDLERAVESKKIVRTLAIDDQIGIERELRDIHRLLQTGQPVTLEQRLRPGGSARIVSGSLAGMCGRVVKNNGRLRFVSQVQFLNQDVSIEVDDTMIAAISTD